MSDEPNGGSGLGCIFVIVVLTACVISTMKKDEPTNGKPFDMPQDQWNRLNNDLAREFKGDSKDDIETAARAVWELEKRKAER